MIICFIATTTNSVATFEGVFEYLDTLNGTRKPKQNEPDRILDHCWEKTQKGLKKNLEGTKEKSERSWKKLEERPNWYI